MDMEFTKNPNNLDIDFMTQMINKEVEGYGLAHSFACFIRNENHELVAGCNGSIIFGSIYTDQLWVDKQYRKRGLGKRLMNAVHEYGRNQGCKLATVATMSFQNARSFYERLGYRVDFEREGYINNACCLFLRKEL